MNATATSAKRTTAAIAALPTPATPDFNAERAAERLKTLEDAVRELDCSSQSATKQISTLARLALIAMEHPDPHGHNMEAAAVALGMIWDRADTLENDINAQAEAAGCEYVDDHERERMLARKKALAVLSNTTRGRA